MLDRRQFLKLAGTASLTALFGNVLTGCTDNDDEVKENETKEDEPKIEVTAENDYWVPTGNKTTFETEQHMIYEIDNFVEFPNIEKWEYNNEIKIPDGYAYVCSELIINSSITRGIKYNYINTVPVEVLEYQNTETGEISYPFAGTPLDLEKAQTTSKIYSKTM